MSRGKRESKIRVGILGATGAVGQKFVELLVDHPWFEITALAASERRTGEHYGDVVDSLNGEPVTEDISGLRLTSCQPDLDCDLVFSALPAGEAKTIEKVFAEAGYPVISNSSAYRMAPDVPLLIPEVNPTHLRLIERQDTFERGGYVITNPNCSTVGLVCTLKPLHDAFGVERVQVTTLQAISGAGYPGVPSLDILGNVIPYIPGEEEKLATEPAKILGAKLTVSAQCNRVPVVDGHTLCVSIAGMNSMSPEVVHELMEGFELPKSVARLPSAPHQLIYVHITDAAPQPRLDVKRSNGMTISVGRIQKCAVNDVKYVALVHNTVRGAAGGAVLNAELLVQQGYLSNALHSHVAAQRE